MEKEFKNLCTPAKVYFAIGIISCIFALFAIPFTQKLV
jgi:hypothetical protein